MPIRFSDIALAYFVIGAMMWGGGAITFEDSGLADWMLTIDDSGAVSPDSDAQEEIEGSPEEEGSGGIAGAALEFIGDLGGGLLLVWDILVVMFGFVFWPTITFISLGAPPRVTVTVGGSLNFAFLMGLVRLIRRSA